MAVKTATRRLTSSVTTLAEEIRAIPARRRVRSAFGIINAEGAGVRARSRDGDVDHVFPRRTALGGGKTVLQVMRRRPQLGGRHRRLVISYARALIAVAKSIPAR